MEHCSHKTSNLSDCPCSSHPRHHFRLLQEPQSMTMAMLKQAFAGSHQVLNENPYYSHKCPDFDQGGILEAEIE